MHGRQLAAWHGGLALRLAVHHQVPGAPRVRAASVGRAPHGIHDTITRRPHSWPFAPSRVNTTRQAAARPRHDKYLSIRVPACPFRRRGQLAWVRPVRHAQASAHDVDTSLPPRGGRRAQPGIISGCPQIVPLSPRGPPTRCPARWRQRPLPMLVKQRSRNPPSRSQRGPNRWSRRPCHHRCPRQCRRRHRNPGHTR
jgi:hypothetical protein